MLTFVFAEGNELISSVPTSSRDVYASTKRRFIFVFLTIYLSAVTFRRVFAFALNRTDYLEHIFATESQM